MDFFKPIVSDKVPCKCCGAAADLYGVTDFHTSCEDQRKRVLEPCGIPIYYHRCKSCGFLFTTAFDQFTQDDFRKWIYNAEYALVDPDYALVRPESCAKVVAQLLGDNKSLRVLDYGSGAGKLAELVRAAGYEQFHCFDPFVPEASSRPEGQFDLVLSFEVVEHSPTPRQTFSDMLSMLKPQGIVVFTTLFQPPQLEQAGMGWWYIGPRNGHVSLFSRPSMEVVASSLGYQLGSFTEGMHLLFKEIPPFARAWFNA